jgi:geranylgeranyl diphosphate synthase type II
MAQVKRDVDEVMDGWLALRGDPAEVIVRAIRHSLFSGGKRIRPVLCVAAAESLGGARAPVLPWAAALEMVHTYTLIHDDLPAMDDDDLRRGKPTCHKVFGEALALLAGLGLLTEAFRLGLSHEGIPAERRLELFRVLAGAAGRRGVLAGQVADLLAEDRRIEVDALRFIHVHKTAKLIQASLLIGAIAADAGEADRDRLERFGHWMGLAFQIKDDILDEEGNEELLGKPVGSDREQGKNTYPLLLGMDRARQLLEEAHGSARESLEGYAGDASRLLEILDFVVQRGH